MSVLTNFTVPYFLITSRQFKHNWIQIHFSTALHQPRVQEVPRPHPRVHPEERRVQEHRGAGRPVQRDLRQRGGLRGGPGPQGRVRPIWLF